MPNGPQKVILINAGSYDYAEIELSGSLQLVGPNNTGKTTLINALQFLYIDDRGEMNFGAFSSEQTAEYYFPNQYSYVLFECLGVAGKFVLGWRGRSRVAGGEPERFHYEGEFSLSDYFDEDGVVRERDDVSARLSLRQFSLLKTAQEHRDFLLLPTRGVPNASGIVALRQFDQYANFRATLKNILALSTITQDQMRERLLMLAGLAGDKFALDIRKVFGEDYDTIVRRREELFRFKANISRVEAILALGVERSSIRRELMWRWTDLREKAQAFKEEHRADIQSLAEKSQHETEQAAKQAEAVEEERKKLGKLQGDKGAVESQLRQIDEQSAKYANFVESLARVSLSNLEEEMQRLRFVLAQAGKETRAKAERRVDEYRQQAERMRRNAENFDRAFVTVLREQFTDEELEPLAQLFSTNLLHLPVGEHGVQIRDSDGLIRTLRSLQLRVHDGVYRDANLELPLNGEANLSSFTNPAAVRQQLVEVEEELARWEDIVRTIDQRENLESELQGKEGHATGLRAELFGWEQFQSQKANETSLKSELRGIVSQLSSCEEKIRRAEAAAKFHSENAQKYGQLRGEREQAHAKVLARLDECAFPDFPGKPTAPIESIPSGLELAVEVFLRRQKKLKEIDANVGEGLRQLEGLVSGDFFGIDEDETIKLLQEGVDALPDREAALRRDWEHQFHDLRATFHHVLKAIEDVKAAAGRLKRALDSADISGVRTLSMEVMEQTDIVEPLRRFASFAEPGLFDDRTSVEAHFDALRKRFYDNPRLRYGDLFALKFTVVRDDGKEHHYTDFKQVESHGTTITIKVLFSLVVLRSLLREDTNKTLLCEIPFYLDEVHSLDPTNRRAIIAMARRLGFIAVTAAPSSIGEVNALYFVQPRNGRIVIRQGHRIDVRHSRSDDDGSQQTS